MEDWSKAFYYDETSPSCLRWRIKPSQHVDMGGVAGYLKSGGYYVVGFNREKYLCHRVIWELFNEEIGERLQIDHINGLRTDNRILNLRLVTNHQNNQNQKMQSTNTSGVTGVSLDSRNNQWKAKWCSRDGKQKNKSFSINKYGYDSAFKLACDFRIKMILELNLEGSDYTVRHGI